MNKPERIHTSMAGVIDLLAKPFCTEEDRDKGVAIIESILAGYREDTYPSYSQGLAGIGCGIQYLIYKGFLDGEADVVLAEVDAALFTVVYFFNHTDLSHATGLMGIASYYFYRLQDRQASDDNLCTLTSRSVLISILDILSARFHLNGYTYPAFRDLPPVTEVEKKDILVFLEKFSSFNICTGQALLLLKKIHVPSPQTPASIEEDIPQDLNDVSILIPVRIDSEERKTNLETLIRYYRERTNVHFIIWEADASQKLKMKEDAFLIYKFQEDSDPIFHHTHYRNEMIKQARTPIIAVWDTDVFVSLPQLYQAANCIRRQKVVLSYPFDGVCYSISPEMSRLFRKKPDIRYLEIFRTECRTVFGMLTVGGVFLADRLQYEKAGMENENFYGWGPEDAERLKRITLLELPVCRIQGDLFHLWHPRKLNSGFANKKRNLAGKREFLRICRMDKDELEIEVKRWKWVNKK